MAGYILNLDENRRIVSATFGAYEGVGTLAYGGLPQGTITDFWYIDNAFIPMVLTPSQIDIIESQTFYTAMMTDTLMEV